jgi:phosphatidylglycerophosphate synthase
MAILMELSVGASWSHLLVRPLTRPLIRLGVKPNHITTFRLISGLATVGVIAWGSGAAYVFAGFAWLFVCLLDRLDGEVARIGNMCTPGGHKFDSFVDTALSSIYFLALGVGLRDAPQPFGWIAVACGVIACVSQLTLSQVAEAFDSQSADGKILASRWGFDADDALYLLGPLLWLPVAVRLGATVLAALGTGCFLLLFLRRLAGLKRRLAADALARSAK